MIMTTDFLFLFPSPTEAHDPISATVPHQGPCPEKMLPNTRPPPPPPPNEPSPPYQVLLHIMRLSFTTVRAFSPRGLWGTPGGQSPPGTLGATGGDLDSCKDSESSY